MANEQFIASLWPAALDASKRSGVDPRIIVAQAALESNWGKSAPGNNLFGIKSHGQSGGNSLMTNEVINGQNVRVRDSFRAYDSPSDSVAGYADFITANPRYRNFRGAQGLENQVAELGKSGYATDPNYGNKILSIASNINSSGMPSIGPDGPKGREGYVAFGSIGPTNTSDRPETAPITHQSTAIPGAVIAQSQGQVENKPSKLNNLFGLLAQVGQQEQAAPVQAPIQGPSQQQAQALNQVLQSLRSRLI